MSKIGDNPIEIPTSVQVNIDKNKVTVKGSEGELSFILPKPISVIQEGSKLNVKRANDEKKTASLHGLYRQLIFNAVSGVISPWQKKLEIVGTGYNVKLQGEDLALRLGFSHPVVFKKFANIKYQVEGNNKITVSGIDKQLVGEIAYQIKMLKKPDVYKGKGIRYLGEIIKLKPGKKVKTTTTTA